MRGRRRSARALEPTAADVAFAELYRSHVHHLLGWLQSRTYCAQVAADLCAETFAVALDQFDRFDPQRGDPGAWLWGIARNLLRRYQRSEAVSTKARERLAIVTPLVVDDGLDLIDRELDRSHLESLVERALSDLSPTLARAVRLRVLEGRSYDVVARECECSEVAARVRVSRALSQLLDDASLTDASELVR